MQRKMDRQEHMEAELVGMWQHKQRVEREQKKGVLMIDNPIFGRISALSILGTLVPLLGCFA